MASKNNGKITHAQRALDLEDELRQSVERYELVFRATNDVLYDLNMDTATVIWNEALYTQFGYSHAEPCNTLVWWTSHIHEDDALRVEHEVTDLLAGSDVTYSIEYRFLKANGQYSYVRDRGFIQRKPDGQPYRIIGSFLDITEQKRLDRAKDEFISLVSHQLRTPLTVIRIYGEMFNNGTLGELTPTQASHMQRITNASIRLIKLVGSILDITKLELSRFDIRTDLQQVNDLIAEGIDNVTPLAAEKQVVINFIPDYSLNPLPMDAGMFEQILHNLLTNAIRYSEPLSGRVTVSFKKRKNDYLLSVADNGIGIPDDAKKHVFDRFYRANNAVNIESQGTGLGLYLAKIMTEAFGGKMTFKSKELIGTTFSVSIPLTGMQPSTTS